MDARLDILSTELFQVNVRVGCIARRQAAMGGFSPEPVASDSDVEDDDDDAGDDDDASDDDGDASSIDEMYT